MRTLSREESLLVYAEEVDHTVAGLLAHLDALTIAPAWKPVQDGWIDVVAIERRARRAVVEADAVVSVRDAECDRQVTRAAGWALAELGNDRQHPKFAELFGGAPSDLVRLPQRKQAEWMRDRLVPGLRSLRPDSEAARSADAVLAAATALLAALDARLLAYAERGRLGGQVDEWRDGVNRLRLDTHGALTRISADKGYGKAWPEAFFRLERRPERTVAPATEPVPA